MDTGYEIESQKSLLKGDIDNDKGQYIINRKNIDIFLDASNGINYDVWRKSRDLQLNFGSLPSTSGVTFIQFLNSSLNKLIKNSNVIRYKKNYITLEEAYRSYSTSTDFIPYTIVDVNEFIRKMSPYWTGVIEQILPATTLWKGGNLIKNTLLGRSKYSYKHNNSPYDSACWYTMIESPESVMTGLECDVPSYYPNSAVTISLTSVIVNDVILFNGMGHSITVDKTNVNWVNSNNVNYSGCSGIGNGYTYTNFVDLLNDVFVSLGLFNYRAQVSLKRIHGDDSASENGFYIIKPIGDTFKLIISSDRGGYGSHVRLQYTNDSIDEVSEVPVGLYTFIKCGNLRIYNKMVIE